MHTPGANTPADFFPSHSKAEDSTDTGRGHIESSLRTGRRHGHGQGTRAGVLLAHIESLRGVQMERFCVLAHEAVYGKSAAFRDQPSRTVLEVAKYKLLDGTQYKDNWVCFGLLADFAQRNGLGVVEKPPDFAARVRDSDEDVEPACCTIASSSLSDEDAIVQQAGPPSVAGGETGVPAGFADRSCTLQVKGASPHSGSQFEASFAAPAELSFVGGGLREDRSGRDEERRNV